MSLAKFRQSLARLQAQKREIEDRIRAHQARKFLRLPRQVGLKSIDNLIDELLKYASPTKRARMGLSNPPLETSVAPGAVVLARKARKSEIYPEVLKLRIKAELESKTKTAAEISKEFGPSRAMIQRWKSEWGLVRHRNKTAKMPQPPHSPSDATSNLGSGVSA